ncbi:MAG: MCE family protein [candidate division Zixibacteria bacterium]|nr:MCE family protein [candidate division Zixibacteria bacterium]
MPRDGSKAELKVGITVLLAVVIFVGAIFWVRGAQVSRETRHMSVWFPDVGSLETGDPVSVSGVRTGKVQGVQLSEGGVLVDIEIARHVDLRRDARFAIRNIGLMGERFVDVETGLSDESWPADSIPRGINETGIPEVMGVMGSVTEEIRELVRAIRSTIGSDETLNRLVTVSKNLDRLSEQTANMVETNRAGVADAIEDLRIAAEDLKQTVAASETAIEHTTERFDSAAVNLNRFVDGLDSLSQNVHQLVRDVHSGKGSVARLINDDQLIRRWEATAAEIDALVADIRENPGKYINVKVEIF